MKVIIVESIAKEGIEKLKQAGITVDIRLGISREELLEVIKDYHGIIVRSVTKINEEFYQRAENLRVVGRAGNGVDNIDMNGATARGIIVVNTPESNTVSAAEHTIGLLVASCRNIPQANSHIKAGQWDRSQFQGVELLGKTLGIVGLGRIGSLVATRMQSFGMKVIAYDPYITDERFGKLGVEKKGVLEDLVKESDFITVHTPKTQETFGMIGEAEFKLAKRGVRVVNCARGGIIDEQALYNALNEGIVASAALDVMVKEPNVDSPLLDLKNTVLTPHLGADTIEAQTNVGITVAEEVISALGGGMVPNAVNLPTLQYQELETIRHYLKLGEILGKIYYQLEREAIERIEVIYTGEAALHKTSVLTLAILKGIFEPILNGRVNYVNARLIAQSRGVSVTETTELETSNYLSLITLKITSGAKVFSISGTVFGKQDVRIVNVNGYEFEVSPAQYMLVIENKDRPGMVGKIGTRLGIEDINIATMQVSRNCLRKQAMMFLTVDSKISKSSLKAIGEMDGILRVNLLELS